MFVHYLSILYVCILFKYFEKHFAEITCLPDSVTSQVGFNQGGGRFTVRGGRLT